MSGLSPSPFRQDCYLGTPDPNRSQTIIVAEVHGEMVGWAGAFARDGVWWIDDLWIEPPWMRQQIGTQLFSAISEHGRAAGFERLEWGTEPGAIGFYDKMGGRYQREAE